MRTSSLVQDGLIKMSTLETRQYKFNIVQILLLDDHKLHSRLLLKMSCYNLSVMRLEYRIPRFGSPSFLCILICHVTCPERLLYNCWFSIAVVSYIFVHFTR